MQPHLIGIAGPSCAGKGELAKWLQRAFAAVILDLDSYYRDQGGIPFESRCRMNYDVPDAIDTALLFDQAARIARGEAVVKPAYDFSVHTRKGAGALFVPAPYVIIEGLFTLHWPELRALLGTRLFIDAPDEVCLGRRVARDTTERGRRQVDVLRQFREQVQPAAAQFVRPAGRFADLLLDGTRPCEENGSRVAAFLAPRVA